MIWRPFSASVKVNNRRFYSRILVKVSLVAMETTLVEARIKKCFLFILEKRSSPYNFKKFGQEMV